MNTPVCSKGITQVLLEYYSGITQVLLDWSITPEIIQ